MSFKILLKFRNLLFAFFFLSSDTAFKKLKTMEFILLYWTDVFNSSHEKRMIGQLIFNRIFTNHFIKTIVTEFSTHAFSQVVQSEKKGKYSNIFETELVFDKEHVPEHM